MPSIHKRMTERGWCVIRFSEEQIYRYTYECISFICYVLQNIDPLFTLPNEINKEDINDEILPKVMRWSKDTAKFMAIQNYRESYLKESFSTIEISEHYTTEELLLTEAEKAPNKIKNKIKPDVKPILNTDYKSHLSLWLKLKNWLALAFRCFFKKFLGQIKIAKHLG